MSRSCNLVQLFYENAVRNPQAPALVVGERSFSYWELEDSARRVAGWIQSTDSRLPGRIGILTSRSSEAFIGILGSLWAGAAYVPINARTPEDRLISILQTASLTALVVDCDGLKLLTGAVLQFVPRHILLGGGTRHQLSKIQDSRFRFARIGELPEIGPEEPVPVSSDSLCYILFTSGTTGTPKGVMVEAGGFVHVMQAAQERLPIFPEDRMALAAQLTFDASVYTMFAAWNAGASLHVIPAEQLLAPGRFFSQNKITATVLVPSIGMFMHNLGMLKPNSYPHFHQLIFGGEGLPVSLAKAWQEAAPNCRIENHYGPTEASVVCIWQELTNPPIVTPKRGTLAIGTPVPSNDVDVVDAELNSVGCCESGELIVAGPQLARGYVNDPDKTSKRFPLIRGRRWYRTGDLVYRDGSDILHHMGRIDNQVKVLGNRVELEEIEAHLRTVIGDDTVAAVAWPIVNNNATSIVAFHCRASVSRDDVLAAMKKCVPSYMIPHRVYCIENMPLGSTGKIDRKALIDLLDKNVL